MPRSCRSRSTPCATSALSARCCRGGRILPSDHPRIKGPMTRFLLLLALCAPALASPAALAAPARPPRPAPQAIPPPPFMNDPGSAEPKKPPSKPRTAKPADPGKEVAKPAPKATARAAPKPAAAQGGYRETLPMPKKIDPRDIDDPYGGVGPSESRVSPTMTPSGRPGVGGRF